MGTLRQLSPGPNLGIQWGFWDGYDPSRVQLKDNSLILKAKGTSPEDSNPMAINAGDLAYEETRAPMWSSRQSPSRTSALLQSYSLRWHWESATKLCGKVPWAN
jgi:hypothetical protein